MGAFACNAPPPHPIGKNQNIANASITRTRAPMSAASDGTSAPVQTRSGFRFGSARMAVEGRHFSGEIGRNYDVAPDGASSCSRTSTIHRA